MTSSRSASTGSPHGLAALLAALSAVGPFSIDAYLPSMGQISHTLGASPFAVQLTLTAYMGSFALMTLWHGAISDAVGRRRVVLWGLALFALASAACALARSIEALLVFRALQGMTAGTGVVVGRAIVRDRFHGADAQRVMAQITLTFALAPAIAPVLGGWLQVWFGWRAIFVFLVLFSGGMGLLCHRLLPETLPPAHRRSLHPASLLRSYREVLTSPPFLAVCLALSLTFSGFFVYVTSAPVFLMQHLHVSATGFLWLFGPATVGMAFGSWLSGRFAGRLTTARTLALAYGLMGVAAAGNALLPFLHPPGLPWSVVPLFFYVLGMSLAFPTLTLLALDLFPARRGLAASCQTFIHTAIAAGNAVLAPFVWASVGTLAATQLAALSLGVGALGLFVWLGARPAPEIAGLVPPQG